MKHSTKINNANFLVHGTGKLPKEYRDVLNYLKDNPLQTSKGIAKALKKTKVYSELKILNNFGFIFYEGYPFRYKIAPKALKSLGDQNYNSN